MARTVTCFPMHRQRGEIIRCASNLDRFHGELVSRYWREEMRRSADFGSRAGLRSGIGEVHVKT